MPHVAMHHAVDPKQDLIDRIGDTSGIEIFNNQILLGVYIRPEMTAGGIVIDTSEDEHQSKIGLILAMGNDACEDPTGKWFRGVKRKIAIGDEAFDEGKVRRAVVLRCRRTCHRKRTITLGHRLLAPDCLPA